MTDSQILEKGKIVHLITINNLNILLPPVFFIIFA